MKKYFTILILAIFILSCSKNQYEKELIGNWNNFPAGGETTFKLYKDSIIIFELGLRRKGTWEAYKNQIKFHFPKKISGYNENLTLDYKLSKDSLFIKNTTDSIFSNAVLLKINNLWDHYLKEIDMKIELPKADFELIRNDSMYYGIDLYVGFKDNKIITKSNTKPLELNKDLHSLVFSERANKTENEVRNMYFNLISDKNISEKKVDSIEQVLRQSFTNMRIFRVYKNDNADYGKRDFFNQGEIWNWYGRYE